MEGGLHCVGVLFFLLEYHNCHSTSKRLPNPNIMRYNVHHAHLEDRGSQAHGQAIA